MQNECYVDVRDVILGAGIGKQYMEIVLLYNVRMIYEILFCVIL